MLLLVNTSNVQTNQDFRPRRTNWPSATIFNMDEEACELQKWLVCGYKSSYEWAEEHKSLEDKR
jgi:hypothetical protein